MKSISSPAWLVQVFTRFKTHPVFYVLVGLLSLVFVGLLGLFFWVARTGCPTWTESYLGLTEKNEALKFLGISMGGVLLASATLERAGITFKQMPYDVKARI